MKESFANDRRLSQRISLASINQKGIPSLEDDRTTFTKSLEGLNNNSNFSKTSASLACNSQAALKKSIEFIRKLIKLNIKNNPNEQQKRAKCANAKLGNQIPAN